MNDDLAIIYRHIVNHGGQISRGFDNPDWFIVLLGTPDDRHALWQEFRGKSCVSDAARWLRRQRFA
jgi:hypothetical protein